MTQEKFEPIKKHINSLVELHDYLANHVVWENQEGQKAHFDNLSKAEQIAIIDMFNKVKQVISSIDDYQHWFMT